MIYDFRFERCFSWIRLHQYRSFAFLFFSLMNLSVELRARSDGRWSSTTSHVTASIHHCTRLIEYQCASDLKSQCSSGLRRIWRDPSIVFECCAWARNRQRLLDTWHSIVAAALPRYWLSTGYRSHWASLGSMLHSLCDKLTGYLQ
jgi:hypothetical protein